MYRDPELKFCNRCETNRKLTDFYKRKKKGRDAGYLHICKFCKSELNYWQRLERKRKSELL